MADSTIWWLLAAGLVALELITGTFFLLMLAVGVAAGAIAAHLGFDFTTQLIAAGVVGGGSIVAWQRWRKRFVQTPSARANRDVNLDIGQIVQVESWEPDGTSRVRYRGADWTVQSQSLQPPPSPGVFQIVAVEGSRLVVKPTLT